MGKYFEVLLVEDSQSDVDLIKESLLDNGASCNLNVVNDGFDVIKYLKRKDLFMGSIRPDLILLDLNLPNRTGFEILEELKLDADLKSIPIIILTSSEASIDINRCYKLYANAYIVKPNNLAGFRNIVKQIENFWFSIAELSYNEVG